MRYLVPLGNWTDRVHCQSLPQVLHGEGPAVQRDAELLRKARSFLRVRGSQRSDCRWVLVKRQRKGFMGLGV